MFRQLVLGLLAIVSPLTVTGAGPTVYASGINYTAAGGISSFDPNTGLSLQNVAFGALQVNAQVTADGAKAVYVTETASGIYGVVVYSMSDGALLGSIPVPSDGSLALSPDSVRAYVIAIEGGLSHVVEVDLQSLAVVLDVAYSAYPGGQKSQPIAVSADGKTVFVEDGEMLYALDAGTLEVRNSGSALLQGIGVTPDGKYLFGLVALGQAIEFVSTVNLNVSSRVDLPAVFTQDFEIVGVAIAGDGSTVAILGGLTYYNGAEQQPSTLR